MANSIYDGLRFSDRVQCIRTPVGEEWRLIQKGYLHRLDGPAVTYINDHKAWYINGERHRIDGPAVITGDGYKAWWIMGKQYTESEYWAYLIKIGAVNKDNNEALSGLI